MAHGSDRSDRHAITERRMTVARVRLRTDFADVMFFESARIYRLNQTAPDFEEAVQVLREAAASGQAIWVRLTEPNGSVIAAISRRAPKS